MDFLAAAFGTRILFTALDDAGALELFLAAFGGDHDEGDDDGDDDDAGN